MKRALALAALLGAAAGAPAAACGVALAAGLDISSSVNAREYEIQLGGLAAALRHEDVRAAIRAHKGGVAIAVYEWSGYPQQDMIADWTRLRSDSEIDALAARLDAHRRRYAEFSTAIGRAARYGARLLARAPEDCARRVLDLSGDGVNNEAESVSVMRARGAFDGMSINALVIAGAYPDPVAHYRETVIGGPGAFLLVARNGFDDYPELIRAKLLRELKPPELVGALR